MKIVPDKKHKNLYRLQWSDGVLSADFYNRTRAKEHIRSEEVQNMTLGQFYNASVEP